MRDRLARVSDVRDIVSYGHSSSRSNALIIHERKGSESKSTEEAPSTRRLASTIVTPSWIDHEMEENVTKRAKGSPQALSFDTLSEKEFVIGDGEDQIIDALTDMDIADQQDGGLMDCDVHQDDLMGIELADMEDKTVHAVPPKSHKAASKAPRGSKHGSKLSIPLGIQNKKFGILRR